MVIFEKEIRISNFYIENQIKRETKQKKEMIKDKMSKIVEENSNRKIEK